MTIDLTTVLVGDSYGLPNEGLPPKLISLSRRIPVPWSPTSDDSEHTLLVLDALNRSRNAREFSRRLAWNLRFWLLACPPAVGLATLRSCVKLWFGAKRGVFSAGNGPCMRVAALVARAPHEHLSQYIVVSTELTHTDPKANWGCMALAFALQHPDLACEPARLLGELRAISGDIAWLRWLSLAEEGIASGWHPSVFTEKLGSRSGVSGYVLHSIPVVLYTWLRAEGKAAALREIVLLGGDTDTTAALLAPLLSLTDPEGLARDYPVPIDWPVNANAVRSLLSGKKLSLWFYAGLLVRNLSLMPVYLLYGSVRRFIRH
jgi:ADP-ribosylglycohydrolase